ncbi:MAG: methylmalonyl-CoA carboxyltransferase [Thermoleophilia bacterium]|nr:methylmalonyl-CoA carboxyltransferase [Thermoleophilia bacterium]
MAADDYNERLRLLREQAYRRGGPERVTERARRGIQTARDRVLSLLDAGTFVELDVLVEGAVTGHGMINGRDVYVFSQDGEVPPEELGDEFVRKAAKIVDLAMKNGAPIVGLYDGGSWWGPGQVINAQARRSAGLDDQAGLGRYSELYFRTVMASGFVPQIAAVLGPCFGVTACGAALADVTLMVRGAGLLAMEGAGLVATGSAGEADSGATLHVEEVAGARTHSEQTGLAHLVADSEAECLEMIRTVLGYLPQNNLEDPPRVESFDPPDRMEEWLDSYAASSVSASRDVREVIRRVVDEGEFVELAPSWAENLVIGFARLGGTAVGLVANQPAVMDGRLNWAAATKAARFVRFCDAFNLPLVVLVDAPGFVRDGHAAGEILRGAAKLTYAFSEATVPKLSVVTGRAYGAAYEIMCSRFVRADFSFAWACAQIAEWGDEEEPDFRESASPFAAAPKGLLDDVIAPSETRPRLIAALRACVGKREGRPPKKHGNILL